MKEITKEEAFLEKLAFNPNDYTWEEKVELAYQGKFLSCLIKDEDWRVRIAVAEQGYGLDVLISDEVWVVRQAAKNLIKHLTSIFSQLLVI